MAPLLVIDGDSLAHRAFHAIPRSIRDADGSAANALVGFGGMLLTLWEATRPRTVLACWDTLTAPTYRNELLPRYQSGREFDPELVEQLERLPGLVAAFGFAVAKGAGYEADDFLAAAARAEEERSGAALVVTSDRDAFQVVTERVHVLVPRKGVTELDPIGPAEVVARYGIEPAQVPDFIALRGDPADRIPGASGVGQARAAAALREHGTLEAALEAGRFAAEADALRLYRRIATMDATAPIPALPDVAPDWARAAELAGSWGLDHLGRRIADLARRGS